MRAPPSVGKKRSDNPQYPIHSPTRLTICHWDSGNWSRATYVVGDSEVRTGVNTRGDQCGGGET